MIAAIRQPTWTVRTAFYADQKGVTVAELWLSIQGYTVNIMAFVMLVLYICIYVYLQVQSSNSLLDKSDARVRAERSLLTQVVEVNSKSSVLMPYTQRV